MPEASQCMADTPPPAAAKPGPYDAGEGSCTPQPVLPFAYTLQLGRRGGGTGGGIQRRFEEIRKSKERDGEH